MINKKLHVNGVDIALVDEGEGDPVLLLHGFPDSHHLWRNQIPALVDAGYRVIAPDLRGFGESSKPQEIEAYSLRTIINDLVALTQALDIQKAHVVGHDWGAAVAWMYAFLMPRRVDHLAVLSVGHPATSISPSLEQREKSWYMLYYQFPGISEQLLRRNGWRLFKQIIGGEGDHARYLRELAKPGALTAGLNWYRANRSPAAELEPQGNFPPVLAPTLGIWSSGDKALTEEGMAESGRHVKGPWRYERIEDASHWIPLDAPEKVNELILGFLGTQEPAGATRRRRRL
ncbi:alpha/beta fold hydrolase [Actinoalloteichus hymeniacidonis]|uniref:Hydrolase or acyltransferase of alpha/beta superfamily n=1 Tax=Actinoalloteichus hymeniacidonis TaxID=340345 RepID=A0AAC9MXK0_9PSEU|nr:alpha/beta hydrolase [Actinoalloteichus hymeniacidonis]AOS61967.1 putative hydrolase or acyltransferase of alpha/beta superfamily [Actinoalloteichus hymeniacidonis]MBB5910011.1 pimeloyl-ACP methyl ester carboxylesterase [Actinoalloteichus hymeniacidonis]